MLTKFTAVKKFPRLPAPSHGIIVIRTVAGRRRLSYGAIMPRSNTRTSVRNGPATVPYSLSCTILGAGFRLMGWLLRSGNVLTRDCRNMNLLFFTRPPPPLFLPFFRICGNDVFIRVTANKHSCPNTLSNLSLSSSFSLSCALKAV